LLSFLDLVNIMGNPQETLRAREKLLQRVEKDVRKKMEDERRLNQEGDASKANNDCENNNGPGCQGGEQETAAKPKQIPDLAPDLAPGESAIIGVSNYVEKLRAEIRRIAKTKDIILIEGPTGTGKGLIAKVIHAISKRKPFILVNCPALPDQLFEGEMFGAVKGAYTGIDKDRSGLVADAEGGTLFLDEIGELSAVNQAKLLDFLDSFTYRLLGGHEEQKADVRIITATNRNLLQEVNKGSFREDLYYRLSQSAIKTEPLKGKIEDIICLVNHFFAMKKVSYDPWSKLILYYYSFPGNVRELMNLVGKNPNDILSMIRNRDPDRECSCIMKLEEELSYFDSEIDEWKDILHFIKCDFTKEDEEALELLSHALRKMKLDVEERKEAEELYTELLKKRRIANRDYRNKVIEHALRVFEILVLNQKAKLNTDELHEALHMRYYNVSELEEKYGITFTRGKNLYEITTPLDMLPKPSTIDEDEWDDDEEDVEDQGIEDYRQ
jgi:transcriptional regulator with GAF, ATPase, and Fis domain